MAITSVGYDGTVDEVQWASMVSKVGGYEYGVDKASDFAVTQSAGTRMISIAAGLAWGRGVMDISDAAAVIQLDAVATGTRYDLVALRRSWGPANGGPSELVIIKGTSAKAIPAGRNTNPGVSDDQPLALVRVQAGSASIPEIIDLRVWGRNGGRLYAKNDLVRSYLTSVGTEISVDGTLWQRIVAANDVASWLKLGTINDTGWIRTTSGFQSGWGGANRYIEYRVKNGLGFLRINFQRTSSTPIGSADIVNQHIANVPTAATPVGSDWYPLTSGVAGGLAAGVVSPNGKLALTAVPLNEQITRDKTFTLAGWFFTE